jgi:hypothetical protein
MGKNQKRIEKPIMEIITTQDRIVFGVPQFGHFLNNRNSDQVNELLQLVQTGRDKRFTEGNTSER